MPPAPEAFIEIIDGLDGLDGLAEHWPVSQDDDGTPMRSFAWVRACAEAFAEVRQLRVVTVTTAGRLKAVAPLHAPSDPRRLELLGARELVEPVDFVYQDESALAALADTVAQLKEPLLIARLPAGSPTVGALRRAYGRRSLLVVRDAGHTPVVSLSNETQPEELLNSRRQGDLRRARRRAESLGSVQFEFLSPAPDEVAPLLDDFFRVEAASWKGDTGTALAYDPIRGGFFRQYAARTAEDRLLRLAFMRIDARPIAAQYAIEWNRRLWLLKIGYDEEHARCSPGQLLMLESLRDAAARGLEAVEFLGHATDWTRAWTTDERPCVSLRAYPLQAHSARALAWEATALARQRLVVPLVRRAGGHYLAGPQVDDALSVAQQLAEAGHGCTIGYWDSGEESPRRVASAALAVVQALGANSLDGYVSVKAPALGFSEDLLRPLAEACGTASVRLHFDSLGPEHADRTFDLLASLEGVAELGCTLPGRWSRSLVDADWAVEHACAVRVVKGEWVDPSAPKRNERSGFLEVVDRLAGRARHVAAATHDPSLAREALTRLRSAGTSCELELLYGRRRIDVDGTAARFYIPFGYPWAPYPITQAPWKPKIAWQFLRDVTAGSRRGAAR